ncbi:alkyl/aryl-sulfatase [Streptomyces sp. NBC_00347]|uniref:alkyl/aryl-sulfatase n=1 Tax=Streptomyces sp. NBC_00347 TaxID=2975721 RepID=UPI00225112C0|nr:alkyl sulfatase dimerization domain-containing protein [Streptomyces sp. NBC_00347]MCX5123787.1 MBL fold metallo-hydrolase [Streptomyces sp. NBC_00347]
MASLPLETLPFDDVTDFENADRGFIGALVPGVVEGAEGRTVWDNDAYAFLKADCPDTAHPSLWRQAQLASKQGLYEVTDGICQVRGLDLSNMTLVEGERGVVVIDPLISAETAAAALGLYREHRGDRPVTGLIYTHSHGDHFGGARGVLPRGTEEGVPILAPAGFLEQIEYFGDGYDVAFASHHWPTWGRENVVTFLSAQRDLYAYMHDQTLRLLNDGLTGPEIAEELQLPPALENSWHARGYYGSLSHNVKAICQRYLGWFNGNVATLWEHPPVELARRYVDSMGGADQTLAKARAYADSGDLRFAATLLNHLVFAEPGRTDAKEALAGVYDTLGHGAENGPWRNFYLTSAMELRHGENAALLDTANPEMATALTADMLIDSIAVRIDGPRAWDEDLTIDLVLTDEGSHHRLTLHNGALTHRTVTDPRTPAGLTLTLTKPQLLAVLAGRAPDSISTAGSPALLSRLFSYVTKADAAFPIVTP